jgi:hypothetical protein
MSDTTEQVEQWIKQSQEWLDRFKKEVGYEDDLPLTETEARIIAAIPDIKPSGGHDYLDELLGLLRVARSQRDTAEAQLRKLEQRMMHNTERSHSRENL